MNASALHDRSMRRALTPLIRQKHIDADELAKALIAGLRDKDGESARREFQDAKLFGAKMGGRLTKSARRVLQVYAVAVRAARRHGDTGFSATVFKRLTQRMQAINEPRHAPSRSKIDSRKEANRFFTTQWGPNRWNDKGAIDGHSDCAPTALVMALSALGRYPKPSAKNSHRLIDHMRDLTRGHNTNTSSATSFSQQLRGINAVKGAEGRLLGGLGPIGSSWLKALRAGLAHGKTFSIAGYPWAAWGRTLSAHGGYLNHSNPGMHAVAVLGMTADGKYLVADPLSRAGTIAVSGQRLLRFFKDARAAGHSPGMIKISRR